MSLSDYKEIILHCGIHKTGSSYLQHVFSTNSSVLQRYSIHYPNFFTRNGEAHRGNHSIIAPSYSPGADIEAHFGAFIDLSSNCETLLISGEEFSREAYARNILPGLLAAAGKARVRFLFYMRRPDHLIESVYAESVKHKLSGDISNAKYQLDFCKIVQPYVDGVGKENIIVRPYNARLWRDGELGADFCAAIGKPDLWREIAPSQQLAINTSLTRSQTFLLSLLESRQAKSSLLKLFEVKKLHVPEDTSKYFRSPEERKKFVEMHRGILEKFCHIFEIEDVDEFFDLKRQEDVDWKPFVPHWRRLLNYLASLSDYVADQRT